MDAASACLREQACTSSTTIVRSGETAGLEYPSFITYPCRSGEIQFLEKVQRHTVQFVTNTLRTQFNPDEE